MDAALWLNTPVPLLEGLTSPNLEDFPNPREVQRPPPCLHGNTQSLIPSATGRRRFDRTAPRGTCYRADIIGAAVRERLGMKSTVDRWVAPEDAQ